MRRRTRSTVLAALTALLTLALAGDAAATFDCGSGHRYGGSWSWRDPLRVVALTDDGRLLCFGEWSPERARRIGTVSGLGGADQYLVGIDFRVQDGLLYGVGNGGGVYTIDTATAVASPVSQLTVALSGTSFGVDFNPAADRLRIVSDTGQNLRHNVNAGGVTLVDTTLSYTTPTPATGIVGAAYTNNDLDPNTATSLFDLDATLDQIALQSPANSGLLAPAGKLTVDTASSVGFDVYSDLRRDVTVDNRGLASLVVAGVSGFYRVELLTGKARFVGTFPVPVTDIAVPLDQ